MYKLPEGVESTFRFILIAAKRSEQLIEGARPRVAAKGVKPTTIALEELMAGVVPWRPVTAEEYELIKQQESLAREHEEQTVPSFPLPLPTMSVTADQDADLEEEEEFDEDLDELEFEGEDLEVDDPNGDDLLGGPTLDE